MPDIAPQDRVLSFAARKRLGRRYACGHSVCGEAMCGDQGIFNWNIPPGEGYVLGDNTPVGEMEFDKTFYLPVVSPKAGHTSSMSAKMWGSQEGDIQHGRFAIYGNHNGEPYGLLALSEIFEIPIDFDGIMTAKIDFDFEPGVTYWLAIRTDVVIDFTPWAFMTHLDDFYIYEEWNQDLDDWVENPPGFLTYWTINLYATLDSGSELTGIYQTRHGGGKQFTQRLDFYFPKNPQSGLQQANRNKFADGVAAWKVLTDEQKLAYNKSSYGLGMSGYNLFLRQYMRS